VPKLDLTRALRIKTAAGELLALKGAAFAWTRPPPAPVTAAPVPVRTASGLGNGTNTQATISSVSCDAIIVVPCQQNGAGTMTPSSNRGGTFQQLATYTATDGQYVNRTTIWLHTGFTSNASHTITVANAVYGVMALTGLNRSGRAVLVDQAAAVIADPDSPYVSNSITPTVANSLALATITPVNYGGDGSNLSVAAPFGNLAGTADGNYWTCASAVATLASKAPVTATFTNTGAASNDASVLLMNLYCVVP
jgi:hypothetical protein